MPEVSGFSCLTLWSHLVYAFWPTSRHLLLFELCKALAKTQLNNLCHDTQSSLNDDLDS